MKGEYEAVTEFEDWYERTRLSPKGELIPSGFAKCAHAKVRGFRHYKREHEARTKDYYKYEKQAAAEVVSTKADLPNIS